MLETVKAKILELRDEMMNFPELGLSQVSLDFVASQRADWIEELTGMLGEVQDADREWGDHECKPYDDEDVEYYIKQNPDVMHGCRLPHDVCLDLWRERKICVNEIGSITVGDLF